MNNDILKMYDLVFEDIVKNYIEDIEYDRDMKLNISENAIKNIAHDLIYDNDYLWEEIYSCINYKLRDYSFYEEEEEND